PGIRVVVPFGPKKVYSALVRRVHKNPPSGFDAKYIYSVIDEIPIVFEKQFIFWEWIAEYYMATEGEVMNTALPPALKLASETRITLNPGFDKQYENLTEKEYLIAEALDIQKNLTISEVIKITGLQKVFPLIGNLIDKKVVLLKEELENPYRKKIEKFVKLSARCEKEEELKKVFDEVEQKAPKQLEVLVAFIRLSKRYVSDPRDVSAKEITSLVKNGSPAIESLVKKGVFEIYTQAVSRFDHVLADAGKIEFNPHQAKALQDIKEQWKTKDHVLLHGVTSSGKTEIYIELIRQALEKGEQVLYLLPEIALTTQIIKRIQQHFGEKAGVYHSKFNEMERTEVWNNLAMGGVESLKTTIKYQLIVGPRSALFLPFRNLKLIIIDEEHETSYKQHDPAPRFHARDAAIWMAQLYQAKVLLGSATPAVETSFNARNGKYGWVELKKRHGGVQMPEILVADIKKDTLRKQMKSHISPLLYKHMTEALENKKQIILFQNRRGFSPRMECEQCNYIPNCTQCDVSLVYHKRINKLKCHYCGYTVTPPVKCPSCGYSAIKLKGFGTEKIEEEIPLLFPDAKIKRMDLDTTRAKNAYRNIISDFEEKRIDILVGTQMVSKGLDFENVEIVGILNADNMLTWPDFRAHERAFQMMLQVSGRAGRKNDRGKVIIQSFNPYHTIIRQVIDNNYDEMYRNEILERRNFHYPPFFRLILLTLSHRDPGVVNDASAFLARELRKKINSKFVLGPEYPLVSRIRALFLKTILVKLDRKPGFVEKKHQVRKILDDFSIDTRWKSVKLKINVDPV
ncbi:MAG: replication restart helicase PriA, partial [Bacteroidota bacterium]